jgi:hypothetical protein
MQVQLVMIIGLFFLLPVSAAIKMVARTLASPISSFAIANAKLDVPTELTPYSDSIVDITFGQDPTNLIPNTAIETLNGGENLGALLWAYVLYNGLFTTSGKPADWTLPILSKLFGQQQEQWYKDYADGYAFECPPIIESCRFVSFLLLGLSADWLWIRLLDGDTFWGWSTGACLAIPSLLLTLGRPKSLSREEAMLEVQVDAHSSLFCLIFI